MKFLTDAPMKEMTLYPRRSCAVCGRDTTVTYGYAAWSLTKLLNIGCSEASPYICPRCESSPKEKPCG